MSARWLQEHFAFGPDQGTFDYYGPLNTLALNIGYHNEHHDFHEIPWTRLPKLKAMAPEFYDTLGCHRSWVALLVTLYFRSPIFPEHAFGECRTCRRMWRMSPRSRRSEVMTFETKNIGGETPEQLSASPRLFESDLLDKLSRVHHLTPVIIYTPIILGLTIYSLTLQAPPVALGLFVGYIAWTLTEYFGDPIC